MSLLQIEVLQEVYDQLADQLLYCASVPQKMFDGIDPVTLQYKAVYEDETGWRNRSPAYLFAERFGDTYLDELIEIKTTTPADIIREIQLGGVKRLPYLERYDRMPYSSVVEQKEILAELISMVIDFETVYSSGQPTEKWVERFVQIAKLHFLRWDRPFIARKLKALEPVVTESRTANLIDHIESQGYKPVVVEEKFTIQSLDIAADLMKNDPHHIFDEQGNNIGVRGNTGPNDRGLATDLNKATEILNSLVNKRNEAKAKTQDPFFSKLGSYFTFVTEHTNPTLVYGQLTKKEVIYSIDNPEGDTFFVFEVIDERGYIEPVRVTSLERAIVCKGDQIHYTDFNKVVKTMLRRLDL